MKIVQPSFEILKWPMPENHDEVLQFIEKIGRTCYKSEDKITPDSAAKFLAERIKPSKHWAMLEHYLFNFEVSFGIYHDIMNLYHVSNDDHLFLSKLPYIKILQWYSTQDDDKHYFMQASATTINYLIDTKTIRDWSLEVSENPIMKIFLFLNKRYPELMYIPEWLNVGVQEKTYPDLEDEIEFMDYDYMTHKELYPTFDWMTVRFIVDRGVTHEMVRHRPCSFAQESTRYCCYAKNKFNSELTVVDNNPLKEKPEAYALWKKQCESVENAYLSLVNSGAAAQLARSVLPQSVKAEIVLTANLQEWKHIFDMRCAPDAHPQIREVMEPLFTTMHGNIAERYSEKFRLF